MSFVPMECRRNDRKLLAQFFVPFGRKFAGKSQHGFIDIIFATSQPKAEKNSALNTESYVVVAKRLVFGHPG